jgi:hypothetical protein
MGKYYKSGMNRLKLVLFIISIIFITVPLFSSLRDDSGSKDILELDYGIRPNLDGFINYGAGGSVHYGKYAATDFKFDRQADREEGAALGNDVIRERDRYILNAQVIRWRNILGSPKPKKAWGGLVISPYGGLFWLKKDALTETAKIEDTSKVDYMEFFAGVNFKWRFVEWMEIGGGYRYYLFSDYTTNGTRKDLANDTEVDYTDTDNRARQNAFARIGFPTFWMGTLALYFNWEGALGTYVGDNPRTAISQTLSDYSWQTQDIDVALEWDLEKAEWLYHHPVLLISVYTDLEQITPHANERDAGKKDEQFMNMTIEFSLSFKLGLFGDEKNREETEEKEGE